MLNNKDINMEIRYQQLKVKVNDIKIENYQNNIINCEFIWWKKLEGNRMKVWTNQCWGLVG